MQMVNAYHLIQRRASEVLWSQRASRASYQIGERGVWG